GPLLLRMIAPKTLSMGKIIGMVRKTLFSRFNFTGLISSKIFLFRI
ncbi:unnamed protein product, partial [marine sediment metagenome]